MQDFPAAHSMDTDWFAVDANGNIAVFDSSEAGAVPRSATIAEWSNDGFYGFIEQLANDRQGVISLTADVENAAKEATRENLQAMLQKLKDYAGKTLGWTYKNGTTEPLKHEQFETAELDELLLILSTENVIEKLQSFASVILLFANSPTLIYVDQCPARIVEDLLSSGEILGGVSFDLYTQEHLLGLFSYRHGDQWENWIAGPYLCERQPSNPLKIEDLPESLQDVLIFTKFEALHFEATNSIQPLEYMQCSTWLGDQRWVDTQGQQHEEHPY